MTSEKELRYQRVDGCTVPVDAAGMMQWNLRYGTGEARDEERLIVASILSYYAHLTDPNTSEKDAKLLLSRARRARSHVERVLFYEGRIDARAEGE